MQEGSGELGWWHERGRRGDQIYEGRGGWSLAGGGVVPWEQKLDTYSKG